MYSIWIQLLALWVAGSLLMVVLLALAARLAVPPVADALVRLAEARSRTLALADLQQRCGRLEQHLLTRERSGGRSA